MSIEPPRPYRPLPKHPEQVPPSHGKWRPFGSLLGLCMIFSSLGALLLAYAIVGVRALSFWVALFGTPFLTSFMFTEAAVWRGRYGLAVLGTLRLIFVCSFAMVCAYYCEYYCGLLDSHLEVDLLICSAICGATTYLFLSNRPLLPLMGLLAGAGGMWLVIVLTEAGNAYWPVRYQRWEPPYLIVMLPLFGPVMGLCMALPFTIFPGLLRTPKTQHREGFCDQCGYDLTGNVSGICPECGQPTPQKDPAPREPELLSNDDPKATS